MKKWLKFFGTPLLAALLALFPFASCSNSSGGTPMIVPGNTSQAGGGTSSGGTTQGGEQPTPTPTPTPTPNPDNENGGNGQENGGNGQENGGNGGQQQQQGQAEQFGGKPYDVTIGNGKYNLHTFMGANTRFDSKEKADYYIGEAETYVKGLANQLNESLKNRPAAQAYFNEMINKIQSISSDKYSLNMNINTFSSGAAKIMGDIAGTGLTKTSQRQAFSILYRTIANEALKAGAGNSFSGTDSESRYNTEKNFVLDLAETNKVLPQVNINLQQSYDNNDFTSVTDALDGYLATAAANIGHDVTADDLRKVVNIAMTTESFFPLHARTSGVLNHKSNNCNVDFNRIRNTIEPSNYLNKQQDHGMELC